MPCAVIEAARVVAVWSNVPWSASEKVTLVAVIFSLLVTYTFTRTVRQAADRVFDQLKPNNG